MDMWIPKVSCPMSMHGCGVVTASKACTKAWVTCVATCDATKFRGGNLRKMEQKCSESRDNWLWSVSLIGNSGHHIYISTRMNCKTHGFLANPANKTVETSSQTHGLLRVPSPCFSLCVYGVLGCLWYFWWLNSRYTKTSWRSHLVWKHIAFLEGLGGIKDYHFEDQ